MIFLKDVTKTYEINKTNTITAIQNINLHIKEGELVVLKGVSGSGKSTILSLIAGLSKPTTGEVIVDNQRVSKLPDEFASCYRQNTIGFIFQRYNLIPTLSVADNIIVPIIPLNPDKKEVKLKIDRVLGEFDILDKKNSTVRNLSGGEQQRVAISRALINNPKIIIADEPTANLDEELSKNFIEILKKLKGKNKTIIVATHDPLFFELDIVDRIIEIKDGKII
jgi:putative ABC transport system ATP-binding protein